MGNEPSALKDERVVQRGGDVDRGHLHAERQKAALQDLDRFRRQSQEAADAKGKKREQHEREVAWEGLRAGLEEHVLRPIEQLTGLDKCVQKHSEEDEDEYEVVYVRKTPKKTVQDRVKDMMREVEGAHKVVDFYEERRDS